MAEVPLTAQQRRRLTTLVVARAGTTPLQRENLLDAAGLHRFVGQLHLDAPAADFAPEVLRVLQGAGTLAETGQPALVSLLRELREVVGGQEKERDFLDDLLLPYQKVGDPARPLADRLKPIVEGERSVLPIPVSADRLRPTPEQQALLDVMLNARRSPLKRAAAGRRLAQLGDPRPGVGLGADGLPDIAWVELPGGIFPLGGDRQAHDKLSAHKVKLARFWLAKYPVTNVQWEAFLKAPDGYDDPRWWSELAGGKQKPAQPSWKYGNHPREMVNWYEVVAFCKWLAVKLGYEVRLPSEEERERATRRLEGWAYPWGDEYWSGYANIDETERGSEVGAYCLHETSAVGVYPHGGTREGIQDLTGNVWEWTATDYKSGETDITLSLPRVLRGGSFGTDWRSARAASRLNDDPLLRASNIGFRVASSALTVVTPG